MNEPLLALHEVSRSYSRAGGWGRRPEPVPALTSVSLSVGHAEIVGLVGESGAGKSTLTRLVLGLEQPDSGQVVFDGVDVAGLSAAGLRGVRRRMHLVLQDPYQSLQPGMRVGALVAEPLVIARAPRAQRLPRVLAALEEVGLSPASDLVRRYPHELSGGQRQRVALARAVVGRPDLVIADEPTSMLDASLRVDVLALLLSLRATLGTAFVFVTHDLAMARCVADRIAVLERGHLVELGDTEQVMTSPTHPYTRTLIAASSSVR